MENKVYCKPAYKCGVCGKEYENIEDRIVCETACVKAKKEEEKRAAEAKKNAEKEIRKAEVTLAMQHANELFEAYINDYGSYEFYCDLSNMNDDKKYLWPSKLLHNFWI